LSVFDKPRVMEKLRQFHGYLQKNNGEIGTKVRGIDLNYNNRCNFKCEHCFTRSPLGDHVTDELDLGTIADIANQADELGIFEFDLQGGELLLRPERLLEIVAAIQPERFYLYLTTNGYFLDETMAKRLAEAGVSRVSVSIDSIDAETHDKFRGAKGAHKRAMEALKHVQNAGMAPYLNITVGHYNAFSEDIEKLCQYSKDQGYTTLINVAVPSGCWQNMSEIMVDARDQAHIIELRKKYKNILRDLWNPFDKNLEKIHGCNTVNRIYVTPLGDVLVCPYLHIKIGNVYEQSLQEIINYGFSIKHFRNHSPLCLAGEDKEFVSKYLRDEGMSVFNPVQARDIFKEEELEPFPVKIPEKNS
jgi:MoaA/NifB/PqqE/SkfB family radical SAM enzyme